MTRAKCGGCGALGFAGTDDDYLCTCDTPCCTECGWLNQYPQRCMCPLVLSPEDSEKVQALLDSVSDQA